MPWACCRRPRSRRARRGGFPYVVLATSTRGGRRSPATTGVGDQEPAGGGGSSRFDARRPAGRPGRSSGLAWVRNQPTIPPVPLEATTSSQSFVAGCGPRAAPGVVVAPDPHAGRRGWRSSARSRLVDRRPRTADAPNRSGPRRARGPASGGSRGRSRIRIAGRGRGCRRSGPPGRPGSGALVVARRTARTRPRRR